MGTMMPKTSTIVPGDRDPSKLVVARLTTERFERWARSACPMRADEAVAFLEAPSPAVLPWLRAARAAGTKRVVCGFLPDEMDWPTTGRAEELAYFIASMEFVPLLLPVSAAQPIDAGSPVVLVHDRSDGGLAPSSAATLAHACAEAISRKVCEIFAGDISDEVLGRTIANAAVVVNAVSDWSLCFAIDAGAARIGRRVINTAQPGYSPLRYALMGRTLLPGYLDPIPRIRPDVSRVLNQGQQNDPAAEYIGFESPLGRDLWRRLVRGRGFKAFMAGRDPGTSRGDAGPEPSRWINRCTSWAMLSSASQTEGFPTAAWKRAVSCATDWLTIELQGRLTGQERRRALQRWVRLHPEWVEEFRVRAGEKAETRHAVARWVSCGLNWLACEAPVEPLFRAARWALNEGTATAVDHWPRFYAWREGWARLPEFFGADTRLRAPWRAACAEACGNRLLSDGAGLADEPGIVAVLAADEIWSVSHGVAAPYLQILAAVRGRRPDQARRVWRRFRTDCKFSTSGGWSRIWRGAFSSGEHWVRWVRSTAMLAAGDAQQAVIALVRHWYGRNVWNFRRSQPEISSGRDLARALTLLHAAIPEDLADGATRRLYAGLYSLNGDAAGAARALGGPGPGAAGAVDVASIIALTLAIRGREPEARSLLAVWPEDETETATAHFVRAVAWQFLGDRDRATCNLRRLVARFPAYLHETTGSDGRWIWTAVILRRAGRLEEAEKFRARAAAENPNVCFWIYNESPAGADLLAEGWVDLVAPRPTICEGDRTPGATEN